MGTKITLIFPDDSDLETELFAVIPREGESVQLDKVLGGPIGSRSYTVSGVVHVPGNDDEARVQLILDEDPPSQFDEPDEG